MSIGISFSDTAKSPAAITLGFTAFVGDDDNVLGDLPQDAVVNPHYCVGIDAVFSRLLETWTNSLWLELGIDGDYNTVFVDRDANDYNIIDSASPLYMRGRVNYANPSAYPGAVAGSNCLETDAAGALWPHPEVSIGALEPPITFEFTGSKIVEVVEGKLEYFDSSEKELQDSGQFISGAGATAYRAVSAVSIDTIDPNGERTDFINEAKVLMRLRDVDSGSVSGTRLVKLIATLSAVFEFRTKTLIINKVNTSYKQLLSRCPGDDNYIFRYDEQLRRLQVWTGAPTQKVTGAVV